MKLCSLPVLVLLAAAPLTACGPADPARQPGGTSSVELTVQPDGLAYAKGSTTPYTGEVTDFTAALTRQSITTWENGKRHGPSLRYRSDGRIKREEYYQLGRIHHETQWHEDGSKKQETLAPDASGYSKIKLWWPDGRIRRSALINRKLNVHGHWLEYAEDGSLVADAIFHHGQHISGKVPGQPAPDTVATRTP